MEKKDRRRLIFVPVMLICSSAVMAFAWLGHLQFKDDLSFMLAAFIAWGIVLPEYLLNISAIRWGIGVYSPSEMAAINLSSGIVFTALVAAFFLGEELTLQKYIGFGLMLISVILISEPKSAKTKNQKGQ